MTGQPIPVVVPHAGVVETVFIIEWLKDSGQVVSAGEEIVVIETEKAESCVEAPASGRLEILVGADADFEVESARPSAL